METIDTSIIIVRGQAWMRAAYDQHRREIAALRDAEAAVRNSDGGAFLDCIAAIDGVYDGWGRLLRRIARLETRPSAEFRRLFLHVMSHYGDFAVIKALRAIFPPYRGRGLHLYRGEGALNRRRRTYGVSWTLDREIAEGFAQGLWRECPGGSVLIETDAPSAAVIRIVRGGLHPDEREVWVDRRYLDQVRVLERYSEIPLV